MHTDERVVGILPAAGLARRLGHLPCSKEILPVEIGGTSAEEDRRCSVASASVLDAMRQARIDAVHFVIRDDKWDVARYWSDGQKAGLPIAYHVVRSSPDTPHSVNAVYPFVRGCTVALGFPDVVYEPRDLFSPLRNRLRQRDFDVVLALFPTETPGKVDTVEVDPDGTVRDIVIKAAESPLPYAWAAAVWKPAFTEFLHSYLAGRRESGRTAGDELFMGQVIAQSRDAGMTVGAVTFDGGTFRDIGTPAEWRDVLVRSKVGDAAATGSPEA